MDREEAERTARALHDQHRQMYESLAARPVLSEREKASLERHEAIAEDPVVEALAASVYDPPSHAAKILSPTSLAELKDVLRIVKEINDELAGTRVSVANVLVVDTEETREVRRRLREWALDYTRARLAKPNSRDQSTVQIFGRLSLELMPFLDGLARKRATVHAVFLHQIASYLPWLFFQGTWADDVKTWCDANLSLQVEVEADGPVVEHCQAILAKNGWDRVPELPHFINLMKRGGPIKPLNSAKAQARLAALAADLLEMRPFLVRDHNPMENVLELAPGLFASWVWVGKALAMVPVASSQRDMLESWHAGRCRMMLLVGFDGLLSGGGVPWLDATTLKEPAALPLNLRFLEAIHARLFAIYDKVDLRAAFGRAREAGELTDESVALSCHFAPPGAPEPEDESPEEPVSADEETSQRIHTLRLNRLLNLLRDKLGCEVRQGKGSEVVIYRSGGKIARLGRHTRNREVPTTLLRGVLERVGISFPEWFAALQ